MDWAKRFSNKAIMKKQSGFGKRRSKNIASWATTIKQPVYMPAQPGQPGFSRYPEGLQFCQEGLAVVGDAVESPGLALLVHEAARAHFFNGFPERASQLCRQALEMAGAPGRFRGARRCADNLGYSTGYPRRRSAFRITASH